MTWSAPRPVTISALRPLHTAVAFGPPGLGDLEREMADPARGAGDKDTLTRADRGLLQCLPGREPGERHDRRLGEGQVRRLGRELCGGARRRTRRRPDRPRRTPLGRAVAQRPPSRPPRSPRRGPDPGPACAADAGPRPCGPSRADLSRRPDRRGSPTRPPPERGRPCRRSSAGRPPPDAGGRGCRTRAGRSPSWRTPPGPQGLGSQAHVHPTGHPLLHALRGAISSAAAAPQP